MKCKYCGKVVTKEEGRGKLKVGDKEIIFCSRHVDNAFKEMFSKK